MLKPEQTELFTRWLAGDMTEQEQKEFERLCREDEQFANQVAISGRLESLAANYEEVPVPEWNRQSTFGEVQEQPKWWQWQGLAMLSFATSMVAILLVTLRVEISTHNDGLLISFAGHQQNQQIMQQVDTKLAEYTQHQTSLLTYHTQKTQEQQLQMNTQLASYLLSTSRTERREDFGELIKFVNQQRSDDQTFYAKQLNQLHRDISTDGTVDYINPILNND